MTTDKSSGQQQEIRPLLVRSSLIVFYGLSVLMGLFAIVFDRAKNKPQISTFLSFYGTTLACALLFLMRNTNDVFIAQIRQGLLTEVVNGLEQMMVAFVMLTGIVRRVRRRRDMLELMMYFSKFPEQLNLTLKTRTATVEERVLKKLFINFTLLILAFLLMYDPEGQEPLQIYQLLSLTSSFYPKMLIINFCGWFYLQMLYVGLFFDAVNRKLENLYHEVAHECSFVRFRKTSPNFIVKLHYLRNLREKVVTGAFQLNETFTVQIVIIFSLIFVLIVNQLYFLIVVLFNFIKEGTLLETHHVAAMFLLCTLNFYEVYCIGDSCEHTMAQANRTSEILHRFNALNMDPRLKQSVEMFLVQLMHQPIRFTACGMFTLDYSILFSIVTSATSYLIILIQFELSNAAN
ncbi:putative gustatory receptor 28b [Uranotaenia lowii]|uniref:putative gustatory receptor 28b n=1 Tax=Uranotaenia lowii TaxID=190385 RepID=UPI002479101B|nr:putative gustatory receptor 28b [Uranotaenia lowii]